MLAPLLLLIMTTGLVLNVSTSDAAKILIYPIDCGFNSRLMNMLKIADILNGNGHNATVLVNSKIAKRLRPEGTKLILYNIPNVDDLLLLTDEVVIKQFKDINLLRIVNFIDYFIKLQFPFCQSVVGTNVIHDLKAEGYDLVIIDNIWDCGRILVDYLDVPSMTYSNFGFTPDPFAYYPALPSFVCNPGTTVCSSDKMNFVERLSNFFQWVLMTYVIIPKQVHMYDELKNRYNLNTSKSLIHAKAYRSLAITNGDFVLDYPRPLMPHVLMIPSLYHRTPKTLPNDLLTFIEASDPHGIVVVSFGAMVDKVDEEKAEIFAKVLSELPQRVLWRHKGESPRALGENTRLVSWFPQADVLGHPLMKMFVTHCGISGTYEAAMNAIPVIAIPMFIDQMYNSRKLTERGGMGVRIDLDTMTETIFREAVTEVMSNKTYLWNAQRVARLLKDEEIPAKKKLLYWVEYTIRHDGALHLISETALGMSNFVFYSVDVVLFLIAVVITLLSLTVTILYCTARFIYHRLVGHRKIKMQ